MRHGAKTSLFRELGSIYTDWLMPARSLQDARAVRPRPVLVWIRFAPRAHYATISVPVGHSPDPLLSLCVGGTRERGPSVPPTEAPDRPPQRPRMQPPSPRRAARTVLLPPSSSLAEQHKILAT